MTADDLLPELAVLPGHLLWRAHARVLLLVASKLPPDVDVHSYAVLLALADGHARSQQALAETVKVSPTTMTAVAIRLAAAGLVDRVRNPDDRRSYALTRTRNGASAVRLWEQHVLGLEDAIAGGFTDADRADFRDLLLAVVRDEIADHAPDELVSSIGFLITRVHFRMHRAFVAALEPLDLEPRHYGTLVALTATGPVVQADLARRLGVSAASVVQIVDDLESRGLLERRRSSTDRRAQVLHLRRSAPTVLDEAGSLGARIAGTQLAPLSQAQSERLVQLLHRFVVAG